MAKLVNPIMKLSRFTNDAAGLEKTLRLLQSLTLIIATNAATSAAAVPWIQARKQFALGRRYLRFTKFIDCFSQAFSCFTSSNSGLVVLLEVGKWSCLGMYLLLESFTIMDAMGIWSTEWAPRLFIEAMKFWFYSLSFSLFLSFIQLYSLYTQPSKTSTTPITKEKEPLQTEKEKEKEKEKKEVEYEETKEWSLKRSTTMRKIVIDSCDLFIPGVAVGWVALRPDILGTVMATSTLLASVDIWGRVNPV